ITENARVRGFPLEGYGVLFDVEVPGIEGTALAWSFRTLDQNDLGLDRALKEIKAAIESKGDTNLDQAFKRIELQVAPAIAVAAGRQGREDGDHPHSRRRSSRVSREPPDERGSAPPDGGPRVLACARGAFYNSAHARAGPPSPRRSSRRVRGLRADRRSL